MESLSRKLKQACVAGDLDVVERLLDAGADPNAIDDHGSGTLLSFHPAILTCLIARGADPNVQVNENGASVLAGLACANQAECVRILLEHGADPDRGRAASGETPLHHALAGLRGESGAVVKLLLDYGADPALLDANGDTPRAWASWHVREWEIVEMLDPDRRGAM